MKRKGRMKQPSLLKMAIKATLILLVFFGGYTGARSVLKKITEINDFRYNQADWIEMCDYEYYDKNYGMLRDILMLRHKQEPEFAVYWEAVKGFEDYQMYRQYTKASEAGVADADTAAEKYRQRILENAKNCMDSRNQKQLEKYVQLLEDA